MKIKFATPEMAAFTGAYGSIEFVDGVSVTDVTQRDVELYRALTTIEVLGEDFVPDPSYDEIKNIPAVSYNLPTLADLAAMEPVEIEVSAAVAQGPAYTQAELEAIADNDGISGIRAIAEPMNIRGTSISKLIQSILSAQAPAPAAAFIEAPAEAVTLTITDSIVDPVADQAAPAEEHAAEAVYEPIVDRAE